MNKEKIVKLADFIEKSDSFSMHQAYWHPSNRDHYKGDIKNTKAGCPACILGHLRVMEGYSPDDEGLTATQLLKISGETSHGMVTPTSAVADYAAFPRDSNYITKTMACSMLRNFVKTGEVEWRVQN